MRRAVTVLAATAAGVLWLVTYRVTPHERGAPAPPIASVPAVPPTAGAPAPASPPPASPPPASQTPTPAPPAADGRFTGSLVPTIYGDVQVRVTVASGHLADVQAVTLPNDRARSAEISRLAEPLLREEAVQARSAQIDTISGATFTSLAYAQSLEDALHQDHLG
jgi:uncharacterized protein with FMN-binding domain